MIPADRFPPYSYFKTDHMEQWLQFLAQQGARFDAAPAREVLAFDDGAGLPADDFVAPLAGLGLIAASGDEAAHFLHNQLTNDVEHLGTGEARLAGYCTAKGRLLATMLIWNRGDAIVLELPRTILAPLQKRLQMFVLRAKVKLADIGEQQVILGLAGARAGALLGRWFETLPAAPYGAVHGASGTLIRVADAAGVPRYQWIATPELARQAWPELTRELRPAGEAAWRLAEIVAGIPQITAPTQEKFVPQMINYEALGGVNFKKGCYPGQEIVARSQYLGKLKRRMLRASIANAVAHAGDEVFSSADPGQPCGQIVNAETLGVASECLVELKLAALEAGTLHLGNADGALLTLGELPYALPEPA